MTKLLMLALLVILSSLQLSLGEMSFETESALHFKVITSKSRKRKHGHATKHLTKIAPCGTGMEGTGTFSVEPTKPDCINEVFAMTDVKQLPVTAMVPIWLAEKLAIESNNDTPFIRRFAIVLATGVSVIRQMLEVQIFSSFINVWGKFSSMLFKPSSPMMLKYMKGTVLKMMGKDIIDAIIDTVAGPCDLIPDVGIAFIGSVNFQLSKWCRFGVSSVLKRILNALIAKAEPLIQGAAAQKPELQCYQLEKVVKLLIGRIDKEYTVFVSGPKDMEKIMKSGICLDTRLGNATNPAAPQDEICCTMQCGEDAGEDEDEPDDDEHHDFRFLEKRGGPEKDFLKLLPNMFKGEVLKYGLMSLIEALFDVAFNGVLDMVKSFISWTNKFVGAAKALPGKK